MTAGFYRRANNWPSNDDNTKVHLYINNKLEGKIELSREMHEPEDLTTPTIAGG